MFDFRPWFVTWVLRRRVAFLPVELLAVIATIGILIALFVPAIQFTMRSAS